MEVEEKSFNIGRLQALKKDTDARRATGKRGSRWDRSLLIISQSMSEVSAVKEPILERSVKGTPPQQRPKKKAGSRRTEHAVEETSFRRAVSCAPGRGETLASWGKLAMIVAAVGAPVVGGGGGVVLRCMLQHNDAGDGFFRALNYPSPMPRRAGLACSGSLECRDAQRRCPFASPRRHVEMRRCLDAESHWIRHSVAPKPTCSAESLKPKPGNILAGLDRHAHAHAHASRRLRCLLLQRFFAPRRTMAWAGPPKPTTSCAGRVGVGPGPLPWMYLRQVLQVHCWMRRRMP
ncbi:hypothetical protein EDB80DRAFT_809018 [Ilyonectria destructans]|nr:hypothetical protein EDB80DRAFT_809018 [Ilyonectria destructans]